MLSHSLSFPFLIPFLFTIYSQQSIPSLKRPTLPTRQAYLSTTWTWQTLAPTSSPCARWSPRDQSPGRRMQTRPSASLETTNGEEPRSPMQLHILMTHCNSLFFHDALWIWTNTKLCNWGVVLLFEGRTWQSPVTSLWKQWRPEVSMSQPGWTKEGVTFAVPGGCSFGCLQTALTKSPMTLVNTVIPSILDEFGCKHAH